ncbi:NAD-P-binding protein [Daedaleopsis nitida]|nr:NAD-P-binding protein [Daedaleopsis nitida]
MSNTVSPRVWLITGTSTGLGRALAEVILGKGDNVNATARDPASLGDLALKYTSDRLLVLPLDITNTEQVAGAFTRARDTYGRIDVVVNNAGIAALGEVEVVDEPAGRAVMETNFWGTLRVSKEAVKFFRDVNPPGHGGRLLQMSSYLGLLGAPGNSAYVASKFGTCMTETLAAELDPAWNIKVTLIEPGWIYSEMLPKASFPPPHPAYSNPELPCNRTREASIRSMVVWKDPRKCAEVFYRIGLLPDPPLRIVVGRDAIEAARRKIAELTETVDKYEQWSEGLEAE